MGLEAQTRQGTSNDVGAREAHARGRTDVAGGATEDVARLTAECDVMRDVNVRSDNATAESMEST